MMNKSVNEMVHTVLRAVAAAMGVAVTVLSVMDQLDVRSGMGMLGTGLACAAVSLLGGRK